ncbi:penicillin-binding protein 2 [Candidatus Kaiserbacteria bacterium]|nr:penicillin-binding protein 2 [Candidatus Kaiserbacteria bacterium]
MRAKAVLRIRFVTGLILLGAFILILRLYQVQLLDGDYYSTRAEGQYVHTVQDLYTRGNIYFTTKDGQEVSAGTIASGFVLTIDATRIEDPEGTYEALRAVIPLPREDFIERAGKKDRVYQEVYQKLSEEEADAIEALDLPGVSLYKNQWRYYPGNDLAARTVGFVGYDGDNLVGRYGLERYYEEVLERDDDRLSVNFFAELFSNLGSLVFDSTSLRKGDVVTSIEPTVARALSSTLKKAQETWDSEMTGGIVINPNTGEVYALDIVPSFDLNDRSEATLELFSNPLVENVYEMGSIIKPLTIAAGLDAGVITPTSFYTDEGRMTLDGETFSNYDGEARGYVAVQEILNQSLNTGVAHVTLEMGTDTFKEYFLGLKLGSETGIDLPGEVHGLVSNLKSPREIEYATASFGQGIALSPIATVRALSTLANGGTLITPHIAKSITYEDGTTHDISFPEGERVFSSETSEDISRMLIKVVDEALLGGTVALPRYSIAAKTGTAQMADQENGGYYEDRYLHSFFGYFPAYEPEFLIFLYTVYPKEVRYASETLTEPFMDLATFLINYYDLPPDR